MGWNLWGFSGRLNRAKYWAISLSIAGILVVIVIIGAVAFKASGQPAAVIIFGLTILMVYAVTLWVSVATTVKRLHDRDKTGWWAVLFIAVPAITQVIGRVLTVGGSGRSGGALFYLITIGISIWAFVELGCLRGTVGENRYGRDPLGPGIEHVFE
jgi:uncharacterized membrane protein YhaH (DUF805 family)